MTQYPPPQMSRKDYEHLRSTCRQHAEQWGRAHGLGAASKILKEILVRSSTREPWAWTEGHSMDRMAERFGVSRATLFRHLSVLRNAGVLTVEVRTSGTMRDQDTEYPIYKVHPKVPYEISYWSSNKGHESLKLRLSESQIETERFELLDPGTPVGRRGSGLSKRYVERTELERTRPTEVGRRRRRRENPPQAVFVEEEDMTTIKRPSSGSVLGADPAKPETTTSSKKGTPASQLAKHFEAEWDQLRADRRDLVIRTPLKPWNIESKARFYKWLRDTLLKLCDGDMDLAKTLITVYCDEIRRRSMRAPGSGEGHTPVFVHLGRNLDRLMPKARRSPQGQGLAVVHDLREKQRERQRRSTVAAPSRATEEQA